jgi:hypothetical protein
MSRGHLDHDVSGTVFDDESWGWNYAAASFGASEWLSRWHGRDRTNSTHPDHRGSGDSGSGSTPPIDPTWTGAVGTDWSTTGNWSGLPNGETQPGPNDAVTIGTTSTSPTLSTDDTIHSLDMNGADTLTINSGATLTVSGGVTLEGGTITGQGSLKSSSISGHGTLSLSGTIADYTGTITAEGGTLNVNEAFNQTTSGSSNYVKFAITSGSDLKLDKSLTGGQGDTITFESGGAHEILDLTGEGNFTSMNFNATISGFNTTDLILVKGSGDSGDKLAISTSKNTTTVKVEDSGDHVLETLTFKNAHNYDLGTTLQLVENGSVDEISCFAEGTRIATPRGIIEVEALKAGDLVLSADGRAVAVAWLGKQTVSLRFADPLRVVPIRIKAGALGENMPSADLLISPDHAVFLEGALIQAGALVNGVTIVRETNMPESFVYYHVETEDHSLILAENTPAETFIDNVDRLNFDNWAERQEAYPDGRTVEPMPYPRAMSYRQVPSRVRRTLDERARAIGEAKKEVA